MGTEKATTTTASSGKTPALCLYHVRARQRTSKVLGLDSPSCPSTQPLRSRITVPFLWEDAPGKPKLREAAASALLFPSAAAASPLPADGGATATAGCDREGVVVVRPAPLKLPPRLQAAPRGEQSFSSPKTVLQGPYVGGGRGDKPPRSVRRSGSTVSCRMMPGTGGAAFSWRKVTPASAGVKKDGHHDHDASCSSPAASSSTSSSASSSSSSMSYFFDVHSRGSGHWQQADGREVSEDGDVGDDCAKGSVRITRFRRNKSLPNVSTSHLWASIRKGVKQISPWS
ncbi:uncharacterized protein [Lolium perenne]|uniref:uncharacterized protein n=1 Tax=Lolium perenne TaxID=4522 RepID=UPI0021EAED10|nr:uncharacterized protein LOC127318346 [Lolium perenne]